MLSVLCAAALVLGAAPASAPAKPRLMILELTPGGVPAEVASALSESITAEVAGRGFFDVLSSQEVRTMIGFERQKQMMGCSEEGSSCLSELAGAMGARFVMSGSIARLGDAYQLTLQTLDSAKAQPIGRTTRLANELKTLIAQLPYAVAEATGTPLPPPPSRVLPYSLMGAGGLALIGGGLVGIQALSQEEAINRELEHGSTIPNVLGPITSYQEEVRRIGTRKTIALGALVAGAALIGAGILLNPPEATSSAGAARTSVVLVPTGPGVSLVGVFP